MTSRSCDQCTTTKCVPISTGSDSGSSKDDSGDDAGAIAGGVIGGVAFIAIATFLVWWFFIRKKRQHYAEHGGVEKLNTSTDARSRKSTHSIASTVLTRASNVIQIAYIPGVTNRSPPETPGSLVPPVPPLPGAAPDQHFFMPGDLRDSSWSDMTDGRSIAPSLRSSVATTIYRNNAIVSPMPAQQAMRTRAAVVNINGGPGELSPQQIHLAPPDAPAVPAITPAQLAKAGVTESNSSIVARSVTAKPVMVKGAGQKNTTSPAVQTIQEQSESSSNHAASDGQFDHDKSTFEISSSDDEDEPGAKSTDPSTPNPETQSTTTHQSPFQDQPPVEVTTSAVNRQSESHRSAQRHRKSASSGLIVSDISDGRRSSRHSQPPARVESPFSDANELK